MKINMKLLPVKAHWFFFMAASGPILPFLTVYGKQLGISEVMMGSITAVLPFCFLFAKPFFGFLLDYYHKQRKTLFVLLICSMSLFYILLYFVPQSTSPERLSLENSVPTLSCNCTTKHCAMHQIKSKTTADPFNISTPSSDVEEFVANISGTAEEDDDIYGSVTFYTFIILMSLAMVSYNVANSVSDAICFDMLGQGEEHEYGNQRVWGAIGFGLTALLGGLTMDLWSKDGQKNYTPAFVMVAVFTLIDIVFCSRLKLPKMGQSQHILKDVRWILQKTEVIIFLAFTALAGILESFIIYFMFWFLEDLSTAQNQMASIKILEGLVVAAETLGGEVIFFPLSGKILSRLGHGHTFTLCFLMYAVRLGLISLIPSPWWLLPIELCMQGPTFALIYTTIVAYASAVAPPGTSATMQGLVAGVDDGVGFAIGSLMGGFLYRAVKGRLAFQIFSGTALVCCIAHAVVYKFYLSRKEHDDKETGTNPRLNIEYKLPDEALKSLEIST